MKGLVLYIDGGCPGNPGPAGYGVHGYHYDTDVNAKPIGLSNIVATTQGYFDRATVVEITPEVLTATVVDEVVKQGKPIFVAPSSYFDMFGTVSMIIEGVPVVTPATNNRAEVSGLMRALRYIIEVKPDCAVIRYDSEYARKGVTEWMFGWHKRNYIRQDGTTVVNSDMWREVYELDAQIKALNIPMRYTHVKGHSGETGNDRADKLATTGVNCAVRGKDYHVIEHKPPEGFWKYASEKHPLIAHRRCYFNTLNGATRAGEYYLGDHGKDDDQQGKRISDSSCSVVRLKEPDTVLEMIRDYQAICAQGADILFIGYLDRIFSPDIHRDLNTYGELVIEPALGHKTNLSIKRGKDSVNLTHEQNPARISWRTVDSLTHLSDVLDLFLRSSDEIVSTEITDVIYEQLPKAAKPKKVKKGEEVQKTEEPEVLEVESKLRPTFVVGCPSIKVVGKYRHGGAELTTNFTLTTGIDILDRNSLKRLEDQNPKVYLVTWNEDDNLFRYATIVIAGENVGIWAGIHSNVRVLAKS